MIELRTFDGSAAELAEFCNAVWRQKYANTDMAVVVTSANFMQWEFFRDDPPAREFLVAAYDGTKLVGVLPCRPVNYRLRGESVFGTLGGFFSVDPAYETEGVAMKLNLEQIRRHRQHDAKLLMGFVYLGSSEGKGKKFWLRQPRTMNVVAKLGHSIRILDSKAVGRFERSLTSRLGLKLLGAFQSSPVPEKSADVRAYQDSDLPDCLRLADELTARAEFGVSWDEVSLQRQLSHGDVPHTFVATEGERVNGFVSYHEVLLSRYDKRGHDSVTAGLIDLLHVEHLTSHTAKRLLNTVLYDMQAAGCHLAMRLRVPDGPGATLRKCGFLKYPKDHFYTAQEMSPDFKFPDGIEKLHVLFR